MRRATQGEVPDGIYLVRVDRVQYGRKAQQPFFLLHLAVLEPKAFAGRRLMSRLYCTQKAMRKLGWFLRDFLYDPELLRGERNRRACPARPDRREDEPHGRERHRTRELDGSRQRVGGTIHSFDEPRGPRMYLGLRTLAPLPTCGLSYAL